MYSSRLRRIASVALVFLAACSTQNRVVTLRHGETGKVVECREQAWAEQSSAKQSQECVSTYVISCRVEPRGHVDREDLMNACIGDYQRDGYVIIKDSEAEEDQSDKPVTPE